MSSHPDFCPPTVAETARYEALRSAVHFVEGKNDWDAAAAIVARDVSLTPRKLLQVVKARSRSAALREQDLVPRYLVFLSLGATERGLLYDGTELHPDGRGFRGRYVADEGA